MDPAVTSAGSSPSAISLLISLVALTVIAFAAGWLKHHQTAQNRMRLLGIYRPPASNGNHSPLPNRRPERWNDRQFQRDILVELAAAGRPLTVDSVCDAYWQHRHREPQPKDVAFLLNDLVRRGKVRPRLRGRFEVAGQNARHRSLVFSFPRLTRGAL